MATINPVFDITIRDIPRLIWTGVSTADTMTSQAIRGPGGLAGSVAFTGTFGSATVKLRASNDGTNFFDMTDVAGNAISASAASYFEFSTAAAYLTVTSSGGTADNVDVTVLLRA